MGGGEDVAIYAPKSKWPRRGRTYTAEEARIIVAGLASGGRYRKPMSNEEWGKKVDPRGHYEQRMLSLLSDIRDFFKDRRDAPPTLPIPQQYPFERSRDGGVPLN